MGNLIKKSERAKWLALLEGQPVDLGKARLMLLLKFPPFVSWLAEIQKARSEVEKENEEEIERLLLLPNGKKKVLEYIASDNLSKKVSCDTLKINPWKVDLRTKLGRKALVKIYPKIKNHRPAAVRVDWNNLLAEPEPLTAEPESVFLAKIDAAASINAIEKQILDVVRRIKSEQKLIAPKTKAEFEPQPWDLDLFSLYVAGISPSDPRVLKAYRDCGEKSKDDHAIFERARKRYIAFRGFVDPENAAVGWEP